MGGKASTSTGDRYKLDGNTNDGLTIPTMLTLLRVAVIPVLVALYFRPEPWVPAACAGIFLAAAITDWLDGYLARKLKQASAFGAFLDPVRASLFAPTPP
jgi:CDP-diacylglycerol--glycerol-3-phosphate 3-phosphatidyltransferase